MTPRAIPMPPGRRPARRRGLALVAVLWVVLVAGLMLLTLRRSARTHFASSRHSLESVRARWLARAGVERAIAMLADDEDPSDGMLDVWYDNPDQLAGVALLGGTFTLMASPAPGGDPREPRAGLAAHNARLNVNEADGKQLDALGLLDAGQIDAILDWRDGDNDTRPSGAEGASYRQLPFPYEIRNGPLGTLWELRQVLGIDARAMLGEDVDGDGLLDERENDLSATPPPDNGDGVLDAGLAGLATVWSYEHNRDATGRERVNVNSADKETLATELNLSDALAEAIVKRRGSTGGSTDTRPGGGGPGPGGRGGSIDAGGSNGSSGPGGSSGGFSSLMDLLDVSPEQGGEQDEEKTGRITLGWLAGHLDRLTLSDERRLPARINVNLAPLAVLMTLPEMDEQTAGGILRRQSSSQGPLTSVGELLSAKLLSEEQFKALAEHVTVGSSVFEIRSVGRTSNGVEHEIRAVVDRRSEPISAAYWYESE